VHSVGQPCSVLNTTARWIPRWKICFLWTQCNHTEWRWRRSFSLFGEIKDAKTKC
jgi:hypothetical protein